MALKESYYKNLLDNLHDGMFCVDSDKRITFWNRSAERLTGYSEKEVLGKRNCNEIMGHFDEHSKRIKENACPLKLTIEDGNSRKSEYFCRHKQGYFVPVSARISPIMDSRGRVSGAVQVFSDNSSELAAKQAIERLKKQAMIDPLTGLANRRYIDQVLDNKIDEQQRYGLKFGLLFVDIDHFKAVNDSYGHDVGDKVLQVVASTMSTVLRTSDILGRWGGEEFIVIVLNVDEKHLLGVADKLRTSVEKARTEYQDRQIEVTISIGAAISDSGQTDTKAELLKKADDLMYTSKIKGRNRVSVKLDK